MRIIDEGSPLQSNVDLFLKDSQLGAQMFGMLVSRAYGREAPFPENAQQNLLLAASKVTLVFVPVDACDILATGQSRGNEGSKITFARTVTERCTA